MAITASEDAALRQGLIVRRPRVPNMPVLVGAILVAGFSLVPLGFILAAGVEAGWSTVWSLIVRPRVGELLVNTLLLELLTLPVAIVLAVAIAWLVERTDLSGAGLWSWLAVAPLAIPAFVHSYAWNTAWPTLHGLPAAVIVSVLAYTPFLYLPVTSQLRRLDPALEDAASALGLPRAKVFMRVVLPQLRLSICGGALLVGLHLLGEYGLYALIRFNTFTTAIVDQYQSSFNGPAASMLAGVLVLCCFCLLALEALLRGRERYARVGQGAARRPTIHALGRLRWAGLLVLCLYCLPALGVPALVLGRWLHAGGLAAWSPDLVQSLIQTAILALAGGALTTLAAAPMAWLSVRTPGRAQRALEAIHYYVGSLPGVVVALALVTIAVRVALPLYQTAFTLVLAYALLFLPPALATLRPSIAQVPVELEQAAVALGRTPAQALWQVTLRLAAPGAAAATCLVALGITTELTATLMLAPNGTNTLAMAFWSYTAEIDYPAAAPYAVLMIVTSLPITMLLHAHFRGGQRNTGGSR